MHQEDEAHPGEGEALAEIGDDAVCREDVQVLGEDLVDPEGATAAEAEVAIGEEIADRDAAVPGDVLEATVEIGSVAVEVEIEMPIGDHPPLVIEGCRGIVGRGPGDAPVKEAASEDAHHRETDHAPGDLALVHRRETIETKDVQGKMIVIPSHLRRKSRKPGEG